MRSIPKICMLGFWLVAGLASAVSGETATQRRPRIHDGFGAVLTGGSADLAKAGADTINLMAGHNDPTNSPWEPAYYGDFEDADGNPSWNGWTHYDVTQPTENHWSVGNVNQTNPLNLTAWCGDYLTPCSPADSAWGYGSSWHDLLLLRKTVGDPLSPATVDVTANIRHDVEPGYDHLYLSYAVEGVLGYTDIQSWDGFGDNVAVAGNATYLPTEYVAGTDVAVYWRFQSDSSWDDGDCAFASTGAVNLDDITVTITQGLDTQVYTEDFQDGSLGPDWVLDYPVGVGDFAQLWKGLEDLDPCQENTTAQVAFIDDGLVVPGTGGTNCVSWCYGPSGYIVNHAGGLLGPSFHLDNALESPVMAWPDDSFDGITFDFSVYRHEDFSATSPGIFYAWDVRSADTDGSAGNGIQNIATQGWLSRNFVYLGGPDYLVAAGNNVTDLMNPGRDEVQVQLKALELGWFWGLTGSDGTPAPYFDNVRLKVFPYLGPAMAAREVDLAQDNFPEAGMLDFQDPGSMHVRFDAANNISLPTHLRNDPGDSLVVYIQPVRTGSALDGPPRLHYVLRANPVFDPYRGAAPAIGSTVGVRDGGWGNAWHFDLPDTGFLFPGDVLHYYFSATDAIGGVGGANPVTAILPADTTGFSTGFGDPLGYNSTFTVRALPSLRSDGFGGFEQPGILFWNDFGSRGGENEWYTALNNIGLLPGLDYDIYYTNSPSSAVGNGLGGRATLEVISGYSDLLYTSGDLGFSTISNGDFQNDGGDDVGLLSLWLLEPSKDMFLTGDNLADDLVNNGGATTQSFAELFLGIGVANRDLRSFIGNQTTPLVVVEPGNPVFFNASSWIAFGGCLGINTFDAVTTVAAAQRLAQFTDPSGFIGAYPYSAATLNVLDNGNRVISLPYDFSFIHSIQDNKSPAPRAARTTLLSDVLNYFDFPIRFPDPTDVPVATAFRAKNHPNPFNPVTRIIFALPREGRLTLKVYNVRGEFVRTLVDGLRPAGEGFVVWDGTDGRGAAVSSGVYFYEARQGQEVLIGKMALVK